MDEDTLFRTPDIIPHLHDSELLTSEFDPTLHPEVTSLKTNQEISNYQMKQAKRWWIPSLDIYGGHFLYTLRDRNYLNQADRYDSVVGVRLTFEIFDSLHSNTNAKSFFQQSMGFEQQALQRGRSIDAQIKVAKEDLKHDHELVHFAEERIDQGKKYLSRILEEYNRGVKNSIDVLGASQKYVGFQRQYAERRRNYQFTKCNILSLLSQ